MAHLYAKAHRPLQSPRLARPGLLARRPPRRRRGPEAQQAQSRRRRLVVPRAGDPAVRAEQLARAAGVGDAAGVE